MNFYSQKDPKWKNKKLGNGPSKIGPAGCFMTSVANLCVHDGNYKNPLEINDIAKKCGAFNGDLLIAGTLAKELGYTYKKQTDNPKIVCIAETDYYKKNGIPQHFFLYDGDNKIIDPLDLEPEWKKNKYPIVSYRVFLPGIPVKEKTTGNPGKISSTDGSDKHWTELQSKLEQYTGDDYGEKLTEEEALMAVKKLNKKKKEAEIKIVSIETDLDVEKKKNEILKASENLYEARIAELTNANEMLIEELNSSKEKEIEDNNLKNNMNIIQALDGRKTYIGLALSLIALFNLTDYISPEDIQDIVDGVCACIGAGMTVIGIAHKIYKKFKK